ncbi:MAG: riboflavin biosynthesis protein RibF [Firmicutes bacterium]|nr:riboflavin biosynthesis protein RibF [Bacillota bacterium]
MKIFTQLMDLDLKFKKTTIALGTFDGVHIGHQKIIGKAVNIAKQINAVSVVFTFQNHPLALIDPERCPLQIDSPKYKAALVEALGVGILLCMPVTKEFLELSPQEFILLLRQYLNPAYLVVGPNYSYGHKGAGTPELLKKAGEENGFQVIVHPPVHVGDTLVSSTAIRQYIQAGMVERATALLGRPHRVSGPVVDGERRGRKLGFPTANLNVLECGVMPGDGVYAVGVEFAGKRYRAVANVGNNPTFKGISRRLEVHIIDFSGVLYGQILTVEFLAKIRDEVKFSDVEELKAQLVHDVESAQQYF